MTIDEQIQIVEDNLNEYGVCNITLEEFNYLKSRCRADALDIDMDEPMHFTDKQKAWIKNYIVINAKRQRADAIEEVDRIIQFVKDNSFDHRLEYDSFKAIGSSVIIDLLKQLKEQK